MFRLSLSALSAYLTVRPLSLYGSPSLSHSLSLSSRDQPSQFYVSSCSPILSLCLLIPRLLFPHVFFLCLLFYLKFYPPPCFVSLTSFTLSIILFLLFVVFVFLFLLHPCSHYHGFISSLVVSSTSLPFVSSVRSQCREISSPQDIEKGTKFRVARTCLISLSSTYLFPLSLASPILPTLSFVSCVFFTRPSYFFFSTYASSILSFFFLHSHPPLFPNYPPSSSSSSPLVLSYPASPFPFS